MSLNHKPQALILAGDGINCERETALAFNKAGASSTIVHVNDLLNRPKLLLEAQIFALPGGFSFGDELGSGQILALKLKTKLGHELNQFMDRGSPIIGICNGMQVLTRLGALPHGAKGNLETQISMLANLKDNKPVGFLNRWVGLKVNKNSPSPWLNKVKNCDDFELPMRHGEGRVYLGESPESLYSEFLAHEQVALTYSEDVNGSYQKIAGLTDPSGMILGLMPHPEAFLFNILHPTKRNLSRDIHQPGQGLMMFQAMVEHLNQR